ncbi:hypothetical protein STRTU_003816 [Streptomyces tubercidicus]|uniref:Uncharacterized protein n=1 Tax=Streptomyces tubercidicus TaxID=47759 RepID=A0A640UW56_9ACTN|nr:hypothetical protein [Streptomyces tubercidicus]WAU13334.1 hypothetical protein STRTU_003816 [Streptomyces tubercidicus]GFE38921.1 hypothetical protein Stube_35940 [Streptomyces tubercidicus]
MRVRQSLRLLPWSNSAGHPCYLSTDGTGFLSRLADDMEQMQLDMGRDLLDFARDLLDDSKVTHHELRFLARRLTEALRDALRVAESRGSRIPAHGGEEAAEAGGRGNGAE